MPIYKNAKKCAPQKLCTIQYNTHSPLPYTPLHKALYTILHAQSSAPVDSASIIIESTSPVQQNLDCFATNTIVNRHFGPFTLTPSLSYHTVGTVCMVTGTSYTVRLEYSEFSVDSQGWLLDSVSASTSHLYSMTLDSQILKYTNKIVDKLYKYSCKI